MVASPAVPDAVLRRLAELTGLAHEDGLAASHELERVPVELIDDILDEEEDPAWRSPDRAALLALLAWDPREYVRVQVAARLAGFAEPIPDEVGNTLERLCDDPSPAVRETAAASLATLLEHSDPLRRTEVLGSWAASGLRSCRAAIALALGAPFQAVGAMSAIEALAADDEPEIRAAAALAARCRMPDAPGICRAVLDQLSQDTDPRVRRAAVGD